MKRIISLLLVIALVLGCTCTSMAATTKSVNYNHNFFDKCTQQKKFIGLILNGVPAVEVTGTEEGYSGILGPAKQLSVYNVNGSICAGGAFDILVQLGDITHIYQNGDTVWDEIVHGTHQSSGWSELLNCRFELFGKHWCLYKESHRRSDGFDDETFGWVDLDTNKKYPWPKPYTFDEGMYKYRDKYPNASPENFYKIAPIFRTLGYNVTWSKEFNSICITSPDYKGPVTPELTADEKKILDWAVETGYVIPDANGNVDYSAPLNDRYIYRWIANRYGIDRIKKDVNDFFARFDHSLGLTVYLGTVDNPSWIEGSWRVVFGDQFVDGFTLKFTQPAANDYYQKPYVEMPEFWPEDELGTKYIYVWVRSGLGRTLFRGDRELFELFGEFDGGYYNKDYYSGKKAGFEDIGCPFDSLRSINSLILSTLEFNDEKRAIDFYQFFNLYYYPKYKEIVKKYRPNAIFGQPAPYELKTYFYYDPILNWFFKGTDWQKQTRWYCVGGLDACMYNTTVLDWAKLAYGWHHIDYVSDYTRWDSNIEKYLEEIIPVEDSVYEQREKLKDAFYD